MHLLSDVWTLRTCQSLSIPRQFGCVEIRMGIGAAADVDVAYCAPWLVVDVVVVAVKPVRVGIAVVHELWMSRYCRNRQFPLVKRTVTHNSTWNGGIFKMAALRRRWGIYYLKLCPFPQRKLIQSRTLDQLTCDTTAAVAATTLGSV